MSVITRAISICTLIGLSVSAAEAKIEVLAHSTTLLDVVGATGSQVYPAAARALGPGLIVGISPAQISNPASNARGFSVAAPTGGQASVRTPLLELGNPGVGWLEPFDVNASGVFVGQARAAAASAPRYAFLNSTNGPPYVPLVAGLDTAGLMGQWDASAATAINNGGDVAGWARRKGGAEQAFYWTGTNLNFITIPGATSSRAESINDAGLVGGYYDKGGERRGFVFDRASGKLTDFGPVVVSAPSAWFFDFRNVSTNAGGVVAATRAVSSGAETVSQAFLLDDGRSTPILPATGFRDSFAAGISDTGWVVGMLRTGDASRQAGFLWYGGHTFDLSTLHLGDNWVSIDAVYDIYSAETDDPLMQVGTIIGMGTYLDAGVPHQRAFSMQVTLQVPEPQIYAMLGVGLLAIAALRRRKLLH